MLNTDELISATQNNTVFLDLKVIPRSKINSLEGLLQVTSNKYLAKLRIKALPEKGKANLELIKYLSKTLDLPQQNIVIISGHTSSLKKIKIN